MYNAGRWLRALPRVRPRERQSWGLHPGTCQFPREVNGTLTASYQYGRTCAQPHGICSYISTFTTFPPRPNYLDVSGQSGLGLMAQVIENAGLFSLPIQISVQGNHVNPFLLGCAETQTEALPAGSARRRHAKGAGTAPIPHLERCL